MAKKKRGIKNTYASLKPSGSTPLSKVETNPKNKAFGLTEAAWGLTDRDRYLLRLMFGEMGGTIDAGKLQWLEHVFADPESAVNVPQYRPFVAAVLRKFIDWVNTDQQLWTRVMTLAQRAKGIRTGVNETVDTTSVKPAWQRVLEAHSGRLAEGLSRRQTFDLAAFKKIVAAKLAASAEE